MKAKRPRGRPKGTDIVADRAILNAVAHLLLQEPALKPTVAIKRIIPDWTDSVVHRVMGKWRKEREHLLVEARQQGRNLKTPTNVTRDGSISTSLARIAAQMHATRKITESPAMRSALKVLGEALNSPSMRAAQEMANSPAMRALREAVISRAEMDAQEALNSPALREAMKIASSSTKKAILQMHENPGMRAIRELEGKLGELRF